VSGAYEGALSAAEQGENIGWGALRGAGRGALQGGGQGGLTGGLVWGGLRAGPALRVYGRALQAEMRLAAQEGTLYSDAGALEPLGHALSRALRGEAEAAARRVAPRSAQEAVTRHAEWANDINRIEATVARLGRRALREGHGDWRSAEARYQQYMEYVENRLARMDSRYTVEVEPAAFRGSNGRRAESWTQSDQNNPGMREWMSERGSLRLDVGIIDTTQLDPAGNPYRVVAGFDISYKPFRTPSGRGQKPYIGSYYQQAFGDIPIYDIRTFGTWVRRPSGADLQILYRSDRPTLLR
jgi:hypothetical protein